MEDRHPDDAVTGHLVTELFDYDGGRMVTVYVPPTAPEFVVFAGDGEVLARWGELLDTTDGPTTMIVGVHRSADETVRLHEYSPGFDPDRFAAHERFFVDDVRAWTSSRFGLELPAERTAVFGCVATDGCGGGHHREARVTRWRVLAGRVALDGRVGDRAVTLQHLIQRASETSQAPREGPDLSNMVRDTGIEIYRDRFARMPNDQPLYRLTC